MIFARMALLILTISGFVACSPIGNQPQPSREAAVPTMPDDRPIVDEVPSVTITFACQEWVKSSFEDLAIQFHQANPTIEVRVVAVGDVASYSPDVDYAETTRGIVTSADAAQWRPTPLASRKGLLLDLTPFIEADRRFSPEDFYPQMLDAAQWDGGTWGLPAYGSLSLLFYDKAVFDAVGLPYPSIEWSGEDFLTAARQLTLPGSDGTVRYGFVDYGGGLLQTLVTHRAGASLDDTGDYTPPALTDPDIAATLAWYTDLALEHQVMPNPMALGDDETTRSQELLRLTHGDFADAQDTGRAAMWTDLLSNYSMNMQIHEGAGIAPLPGDGATSSFSLWDSYVVSAGTLQPEATWQWIAFLSLQPSAGQMMLDEIPARRSLAEQTHYWSRWSEADAEVIRYALDHATISYVDEVAKAVRGAAKQVLAGEQPLGEALSGAQTVVTEAYEILAAATPETFVVAPPGPEPSGVTTIDFATAQTTDYKALAEAFHETHTDLRVNVVPPDSSDAADCFTDQRFVAEEGEREELLMLQPLADAAVTSSLDRDSSPDAFHPRALAALQYQGDLWGLPSQATATAIYYNRDLFDASGLPYPRPGWTVLDFQDAATALTHGVGATKQYGYAPIAHPFDIQIFLALHDVSLWERDGTSRFDAPEVVAIVSWYADLVQRTEAIPEELGTRRQTLIRQGRVGMWSDVAGDPYSDELRRPRDAEVGIAPLPVGDKAVSGIAYEGFFISADTPHAYACWQWIEFAGQAVTPLHGIPARLDHFKSEAYISEVGEEAATAYAAMLTYDPLPALSSEQRQILQTHFYPAIDQIIRGAPVERTLADAQRRARSE